MVSPTKELHECVIPSRKENTKEKKGIFLHFAFSSKEGGWGVGREFCARRRTSWKRALFSFILESQLLNSNHGIC